MMRFSSICVALLLSSPCVYSRETIHLKSGFSVEADSHTTEDSFVTAKVGNGTLRFAVSDIRQIEPIPNVITNALPSAGKMVISPVQILGEAALMQGLPKAFVQSVATVESGLRQDAISPKGAIGLMQLMPGTAAFLKVDPKAAESNASGGAAYLRQLLLQYRGDAGLALAAYNAGPGAVKKFGGVPPYAETRRYVLKVLAEYKRQLSLAAAGLTPAVFAPVSKTSATN